MCSQRSPAASTTSMFGASEDSSMGPVDAPRPRAGRPKRGFGRFGMAGIVPCDSWTHPEGWRDRPFEAPATIPRERERCQFLSDVAWPRASPQESTAEVYMAAKQLKCRECATEDPWEARYVCSRCFAPLEVKYEHEPITDVGSVRRRIQAG